jgi:DNA-directed RNA polymerase subunit M/transcription elongation factor TFIIS
MIVSSFPQQDCVKCPECGSHRSYKDGLRVLSDGSETQRFLCRDCGYRFSNGHNSSKTDSNIGNTRQLCVILQEAKKLDSATEIKTVAGEEKDSLINYAWLQKKRGLGENTIALRCYILKALQRKGANLSNPDSVETVLATEPDYNQNNTKKYQAVKHTCLTPKQ